MLLLKREFPGQHILLYGSVLVALILVVNSQQSEITPVLESCYCLEEMVSGLYAPTGAQFTVDRKGRKMILVVEQRGTIRALRGDKMEVFMDIRDRVYVTNTMGDSRGLLSAVLSPEFDHDGKIYVYYIRQVDGQDYAYVSQFQAVHGKGDTSTEKFLLRFLQPYEHGNGGPMFFGDDGYLYIVTGDGGAEDDLLGNAQNKNSFHGSVLRVDVKKGQSFVKGDSAVAKLYSVPEDNPFRNLTDAKEEIFALGFRNPWGCAVDSKKIGGDGRIYCVDTGTDKFDEVNIIEKGKNYGWNIKEGNSCLNSSDCAAIENEGLPIFEFKHKSHHALVGGFVYRGSQVTWMKDRGYYTYADIVSGETYYLEENKTSQKWEKHDWSMCDVNKCPSDAKGRPLRHVFAFSQDNKGEIYFLMVNSMKALESDGKMFKLREASSSSTTIKTQSFIQTASYTAFVILFIATFQMDKWLTII